MTIFKVMNVLLCFSFLLENAENIPYVRGESRPRELRLDCFTPVLHVMCASAVIKTMIGFLRRNSLAKGFIL